MLKTALKNIEMIRPIAISLSPNTEKDDVLLALRAFFSPRKWFDSQEVKLLEMEFERIFGSAYKALAVNSGRSAEYLILKALGIGEKDEVIIQALTCVAVPNSILWLGAKPIYADIDDSYNIDPKDLMKKITNKTRAIIVQHTFGIPANFHEIQKITQEKNIVLIEDCSHSLGAEYAGNSVGALGDVSFFSFGRDKVISSLFGGMILTSNKKLYEKLKLEKDKLPDVPVFWVFQQLLHPIFFAAILPLYNLQIGKVILVLLQKLGVLTKAVYEQEKVGQKPSVFPSRMPGALAILARNQLKKLRKFNSHRKKIANFYFSGLKGSQVSLPEMNKNAIWLRFPIRHPGVSRLYSYCKNKNILLGDWYKGVIMPSRDLARFGYHVGGCPQAEQIAETILNLPTYPSLNEKDAFKVVEVITRWLNTK